MMVRQIIGLAMALALAACVPSTTPSLTPSVAPTLSPAPTASPAPQPAYLYTDLGVLGGLDSAAFALADSGMVVGHADTYPNSREHGFHAFAWESPAGPMVDLGTIAGDLNSSANAVNAANQVVGVSLAEDGRTHAFLWDGALHDLGNLGEERGEANAVNALGQVAGSSAAGPTGQHAFLWTPTTANGATGGMIDLGMLPGGVGSYGMGINAVGQVVGYSNDSEFMSHAFLWTPDRPNGTTGTLVALPQLPNSTHSAARAVNATGSVVGSQEIGTEQPTDHAFLWVPETPNGGLGQVVDLGTLGGEHSYAFAINGPGDVVGTAQLPGTAGVDHAFLYRLGHMLDLNDARLTDATGQPLTGVELTVAYGITDAGQIVGLATVDGHSRAFLLSPTEVRD